MKPSPLYSSGARYERATMREHLERKVKQYGTFGNAGEIYAKLLKWVRARESRYSKRPGGL